MTVNYLLHEGKESASLHLFVKFRNQQMMQGDGPDNVKVASTSEALSLENNI